MKRNKPSLTARKVAMSIVTLGIQPGMDQILRQEVVDATEQMLLACGVVGERTMRLAKTKTALALYHAFDWLLPGQPEALSKRKAFCERQVVDAIAAGARQVVVLGAGYDTLCWRLAPDYPDVTFIEIDHPLTANLKQRGVAKLGERTNLHLLAEDLGQRPLRDVLESLSVWDRQKQSVYVAEGLVMYLDDAAVRGLFLQSANSAGPNSRIVFSYIPSGPDHRLDAGEWTRLMLWLQKAVGEPWIWSVHPDQLESYLKELQWQVMVTEQAGVEHFVCAQRLT